MKRVPESSSVQESAAKEAEQLFQAILHNPGVKKLAVNPLLLTILALIQRQGIRLPSHRIKLYELCTTTLMDHWIEAKGISPYFNQNQVIKLLCPLAFWMHEYRAVGGVPEQELTDQIVKQLIDRKIARDEYEAMGKAEKFLDMIRSQTGILVERGHQRYGFLHQTFEEYFAAKELVNRKDKERDDFIREHLHEARWREVILLAVGIIGVIENKEERVTELVQDAILNANSLFEE